MKSLLNRRSIRGEGKPPKVDQKTRKFASKSGNGVHAPQQAIASVSDGINPKGDGGNPSSVSKYATIDDCPQEIIDAIVAHYSPITPSALRGLSYENHTIDELTKTLSWLRTLAFLNHQWRYTVQPLLNSVLIASARTERPGNQIAFATLHSGTIQRLVLDCRYPRLSPHSFSFASHCKEVIGGFKQCLSACTNLRVLDVVCLDTILPSNLDVPALLNDLFSQVSSNDLRTLAIRNPELLMYTNATTVLILNSLAPEIVRDLTELQIESLTTQTRSSTLKTNLPSLQRLALSHISPTSLTALYQVLTDITKPTEDSIPLSDLSFSSSFVRLAAIESLLKINKLGENLLSFRCEVNWPDPASDLPFLSETIFGLCPRLQIFHLFAPCFSTIFVDIPPSLVELGILVLKDSPLPVISGMEMILYWSRNFEMRKNVRRLVVRWYRNDERKYQHQKVLREANLGMDLVCVD